jgi:hypothetical protein
VLFRKSRSLQMPKSRAQEANFCEVIMVSRNSVDDLATSIASLGKEEVKQRIRTFKGRFRLDFTEDYLEKLSVDRLRHILLAALITAKPHS